VSVEPGANQVGGLRRVEVQVEVVPDPLPDRDADTCLPPTSILGTSHPTVRTPCCVTTLTADPIPDGPWDVVHARLVLGHLPERHDILRRLAAALAPGGALAVEEWDASHEGLVLAAPEPEAATLFSTYETIVEEILSAGGLGHEWAWQVHAANISLLRTRMLEAGMTGEQLDLLSGFLRDPRMVVRGLLTISTVGRRPAP
jgi:SAM-dependent methyltransferase